MRQTPTDRLIQRYNRVRTDRMRNRFSPGYDPSAPAAHLARARTIILLIALTRRGVPFDHSFTPVLVTYLSEN